MNSRFPSSILPLLAALLTALAPLATPAQGQSLVPSDWDPALAGDAVMERLVTVTAPEVKGAHDAEMVIVDRHAYIVAEVNDENAGESARWAEIYSALSIVNLDTLEVEAILPFARSEEAFENETLPVGACFVPRIIQKDADTLRCYFASERPDERQSQMWYRDFDLATRTFAPTIHKAMLKTSLGTFEMQPQHFHACAAAHGFEKEARDYGLYLFDSFKTFGDRTYVAINNFPGKQNALAFVHDDLATFEILGHYNEPQDQQLSESAVQRLPDGTWMAILRNDGGDRNYHFATSEDGVAWTAGEELPFVPNGTNSKPTFDRFGDLYYLGWQEATEIQGAHRSVFNIDVSRDGEEWERKYRFETPRSFQYPTFREHEGVVWLCVTQGDHSRSRKERILFGKLEEVGAFEPQEGRERIAWPGPAQPREGWDPALAGDLVMERLVRVSAPEVKGAHDSEFVCVGDRAYIVDHSNDVAPGHGAGRSMYCVLTVVNLQTLEIEARHLLAEAGQAFENVTLPDAQTFVPRIIRKDEDTLRCYFAVQPREEQAQTWYRDFDLRSGEFADTIHQAKLKTAAGVFDMQPQHFHADAAAQGFEKPARNGGMYIFDSFKPIDGRIYVALNNFPGKQNALAVVHDDYETFEVIGHYNEPQDQQLSESAVQRLPDGTWMAILRNDGGNTHFATSEDGVEWSVATERPLVPNGLNSKPTFDKFGELYYLGWQENTRIHGCNRSVFNIDVSPDGVTWERKYRFETPHSFQYPTFHEHEGVVWVSVTQSDHLGSTDRIMFGKLEDIGAYEPQEGRERVAWPVPELPPPPPAESAELRPGVRLFTDRDYTATEVPETLLGKTFWRGSIEAPEIEIAHGGTLWALTPTPRPRAASREAELLAAGFEKTELDEFQLFPGEINRVSLYRKMVRTGERLRFRKMVVYVSVAAVQFREIVDAPPGPWPDNAGETLYNGIVLPEVWPPRHLDPASDEPMPVPYLEHPPEVVPIDLGRQLFVDDFLIESTDLSRIYHQAEKYEGNPVFVAETETEKERNETVYLGQGGVFYDPAEGHYKMFYTAGWRGPLAMATSTDLKTWTRPDLGLHEGNVLLPEGPAWGDGTGSTAGTDNALWFDIAAENPAERIRYVTCWMHVPRDQRVPSLTHSLQVSDGTTWSEPVRCNAPAEDYGSFFFNPFRDKWVQSIKQGSPRGRSRYYLESDTFLGGADWANAVYWTNADRLDRPEPAGAYPGYPGGGREGDPPQLYSLAAVAYESLMIGMHQVHRGPENRICHEGGFPKLTDLELGFSRDGFHWHRPDRRGFIRGERRSGTWDRAYLHTTTGVFLVHEDRLVFPYCAYSGDAGGGKGDIYGGGAIGLATLRRDGFASMEAGTAPGELTTRPLLFSGKHLFVNLDNPLGELVVEVLDEQGEIAAVSQPITDDSTIRRIDWEDIEDLAAHAGTPTRLRFRLTNGALYAFWISPDESGSSGGYLAAGGPGHKGLTDTLGLEHPHHQRRRDALLPPEVHTPPLPLRYHDHQRMYLCGPGIAVSPGGRLWVTFKTGDIGEDEDNCTLLVTSGDGGETWSDPVLAIDIPGAVRTNDPGIWTDPEGRVTLMFGQVHGYWDGRGGFWTMTAEDGDREDTAWSEPVRLSDGYTKNKPFVTRDGKWLYLIEHMGPAAWRGHRRPGPPTDPALVHPRPELNHANVFVSEDQGRTLQFYGQAKIPEDDKTFQEHMVVEKRDGTLWMLGRTKYGIGEAFSSDQGRTWTEMAPAEGIAGPSSRIFFRRLASGNLLLIKNGAEIDQRSGRTHLTAYLSEDDGETWPHQLLLDERATSYPDADQDADGALHIVHDFGRHAERIVYYHRITEEDIKAGDIVGEGSALGIVANQSIREILDRRRYEEWRRRQGLE